MLTIKNTTRGRAPKLPYEKITAHILGAKYSLSLVLCGNALSKTLNRDHRKKDTPTNVLAFPLASDTGEIFLNIDRAKKEAKDLSLPIAHRTAHLFIHSLLHLKGVVHGSKMEHEEEKILRRFGFY